MGECEEVSQLLSSGLSTSQCPRCCQKLAKSTCGKTCNRTETKEYKRAYKKLLTNIVALNANLNARRSADLAAFLINTCLACSKSSGGKNPWTCWCAVYSSVLFLSISLFLNIILELKEHL